MNFTYQPNFRDSYHGVLFGFWGTSRRALNSVLFGLIFGILIGWVLWYQPVPTYLKILLALFAGVLWIVGFSFLFGLIIAWLTTSRQRARGNDVIQLNDQWVERTSGTLSIKQEWSGVERITETPRVFLLWDKSRPIFSIEKSAVPDEAQLRSLRHWLRGKKPGDFLQDADADPTRS